MEGKNSIRDESGENRELAVPEVPKTRAVTIMISHFIFCHFL
jgi:hypothetical protein